MVSKGGVVAIVVLLAVACSSSYGTDTEQPPSVDHTCDACVAPPAGWTLVDTAQTCSAGWSAPATLVENPRLASPFCTCECGKAKPEVCEHGTALSAFQVIGSTCSESPTPISATGECVALPEIVVKGYAVVPVPFEARDCDATAKPASIVDDGRVTTCSAPSTDAKCGACILPPAGSTLCLLKEGKDACPSGWPARRVFVRSEKIAALACSACSCKPKGTKCNAELGLYDDAECMTNEKFVPADGACRAPPVPQPKSFKYRATPDDPSCAPVEAQVTASFDAATAPTETLCCR